MKEFDLFFLDLVASQASILFEPISQSYLQFWYLSVVFASRKIVSETCSCCLLKEAWFFAWKVVYICLVRKLAFAWNVAKGS